MPDVTSTSTGSPIYTTLADGLRKSIRKGQFQPGDLIGSEHELARRENISRMTVRRASEILVNEGLLERRPGKGLYVRPRNVSTRSVQIVAANLQWEPCLQISRGAQTAAKDLGIQAQLYDAHGDADLDAEVVRQLPAGPARGAIIVSLHSAAFSEALFALRAQRFPFVLVDQRLRDIEVPSVMADNYDGGMQVGRTLVEHGHRRIAFIGDLHADTVQGRLTGLRDAWGQAGLPFDPALVCDLVTEKDRLGDWSERVRDCVESLMAREDRPTALACSCDAVARWVYRALEGMGLKVPDDVSVIGFDDDPLAEWLSPPLSTVRQPFLEMGQAAMRLLNKAMLGGAHETVEHEVLPVRVVNRASVAAPAGRLVESMVGVP